MDICGDLSFEEGGNPVTANRIVAGQNPLTVDSYCAELIGYRPGEIEYLTYGREIGVGEYYSEKTEIVELNPQNKPLREIRSGRTADKYKSIIDEDAACSASQSPPHRGGWGPHTRSGASPAGAYGCRSAPRF